MPGAGSSTSRINRDVFARLGDEPKSVFAKSEEDLQYPQNLGGDEYNQFVLFTMYEKSSAEMKEQSRKVISAGQQLNAFRDETAKEFAESGVIRSLFGESASYITARIAQGVAKAAENAFEGLAEYQFNLALDSGVISLSTSVANFLQRQFTSVDYSEENEAAIKFLKTDEGREYVRKEFQAIIQQEADTRYNNNVEAYKKAYDQREASKQFISTDESFLKDRSQSTIEYADSLGLGIKDRSASNTYNRVRLGSATQKAPTNIALYIPNKIVNNANISYNGVNFSTLTALGGIITGDFAGAGPLIKRTAGSIADSALSLVGTDLNSEAALQAVSGLAINPKQQMMFQGVNTRSFDFSFSFAPRNQNEAKEVNKIVRAFRRYAHPELAISGYMLDVPAEFEVRYYKVYNDGITRENLFLNKIGRCALTAINVDFTPNAVMSTFPDGSPVRTTVVMSFQELRPLTREDIEEGY